MKTSKAMLRELALNPRSIVKGNSFRRMTPGDTCREAV